MENEPFTAPFVLLRLLTPLKMTYKAAKKRAEPYTKTVEELPEMRRDTGELVKKAVKTEVGCPQIADVRCPLFADVIVRSVGLG